MVACAHNMEVSEIKHSLSVIYGINNAKIYDNCGL